MRTEKKSHRARMDPIVTLVLIFAVLKVTGLISWPWLCTQPDLDYPFDFRCYFFFHFGRWTNR